jgi:hypothetical protein
VLLEFCVAKLHAWFQATAGGYATGPERVSPVFTEQKMRPNEKASYICLLSINSLQVEALYRLLHFPVASGKDGEFFLVVPALIS